MPPARNMAQVPRLPRPDQLPTPVRPSADDAASSDDRSPPPAQQAMLAVAVEQPLLRTARRMLVSKTAEPLIRHPRNEHRAAEVALPSRECHPRRRPFAGRRRRFGHSNEQ
jgi:hypothetical protein